jgi:hypothetical protein
VQGKYEEKRKRRKELLFVRSEIQSIFGEADMMKNTKKTNKQIDKARDNTTDRCIEICNHPKGIIFENTIKVVVHSFFINKFFLSEQWWHYVVPFVARRRKKIC